MKIILSWLKEFVALDAAPRQIAADLTMLGFAVDGLTHEQGETIFELDITTNRPDALNHYGIARELAARYGVSLEPAFGYVPPSALPHETKPRARGSRKDGVVEIKATDLCPRYSARILRGVEVKPSPDWLRQRLELCGVRAINNIADATNYILLAYGHPLHAFDLDRLQGGRIVVRNARDGEKLKTLDGIERALTPPDLVIADAKNAVALAGIMGGESSEITVATRNVLIEAAWFDPSTVRRSAKAMGMRTEASHRFERGADIAATLPAASKCAELIQSLAGGVLDPVSLDAYPKPTARPIVILRRAEIARHLGMDVPSADVMRILSRLGFSPRENGRIGHTAWTCIVPSHRADISREIDFVEEIARHYGFDKFPVRLPASSAHASHRTLHARKEERVVERVLTLGYDETISAVMVSRAALRYGAATPVALSNPLSEESAVLRTSMIPGLLEAIEWNMNRGQRHVRLFEIGKTYARTSDGCAESAMLCLAATGGREPDQVGAAGRSFDFFDMKGDVAQLAELFALREIRIDARELPDYYRAGHAARLTTQMTAGGKLVARFGQLSSAEMELRKFRQPVFLAEVSLDPLYAHALQPPQVKPISRFPEVERDFSLTLSDETTYEAVHAAVLAAGITGVESIRAVETFRGGSLPAGNYSLLLRVTLQSAQGTFTEAELADASAKIVAALEARTGARIRSAV
ncbi:MAG: phenylalanine--tRNA ligase subunit beta [Acidobacteria bacterium]|nr:phenylalanine--tRNA ligase subunit beta [Acidobacteriota bacterium]